MSPRIVEVRQNVLKQNDLLARELRRRFQAAGTFVVNLVSGPGSGKTALLEATLTALRDRYRVAALTGGLATDNDAPTIFNSADLAVITKCDLAAAVDFDRDAACGSPLPLPALVIWLLNGRGKALYGVAIYVRCPNTMGVPGIDWRDGHERRGADWAGDLSSTGVRGPRLVGLLALSTGVHDGIS